MVILFPAIQPVAPDRANPQAQGQGSCGSIQVCMQQDKAEIVTRVSYKLQGSNTQTPVLALASRANTSLKKIKKVVHVTIEAGWNLKRSTAQPLAQSRASCRTRLDCLGPYPIRSWKCLRMETAQSFCVSCSTAWPFLQWNRWGFFLYPAGLNFFVQFSLLFLILLPCTAVKSLALPSWEHSCGRGSSYEVLKTISSPRWTSPSIFSQSERPYPA